MGKSSELVLGVGTLSFGVLLLWMLLVLFGVYTCAYFTKGIET
jgi:hypothetical protein